MVHYTLTYFNLKALGEPVRYILSYMGREFEEVRLDRDKWGPSQKKCFPFGKLPVLEIDGKEYSDSRAICRYLAIEAGLSGRDPQENFAIDQVIGALSDLIAEISKMFREKDPATKKKLKEIVLKDTLPFYMERFERIIEENNGYLANGRLSWADLYFVAYSESLPFILGFDLSDKYKNFKALKERVQSFPNIQSWIKRRPDTPM